MKKRYDISIELNEKQIAKVEQLALRRNESFEQTLKSISQNTISRIPRKLKYKDMPVSELDVKESGIDSEGFPFVRLANGRIFYDHPGSLRAINLHYLYKDITPKEIKPEAHWVAMNIMKRYHIRARHLPIDAKIAVEVGAYVGYKAIGYLDHMENDGRVIAIELAPENFRILEKNISENQLERRIVAVNKGVWHESTKIPYIGASKMQFALSQMHNRDYQTKGSIDGDTIDNILSQCNVDVID